MTDIGSQMAEDGPAGQTGLRRPRQDLHGCQEPGAHRDGRRPLSNREFLIRENARDIAGARTLGLSGAMIDRLALTEKTIEGIARA